MKKIKIDWPNHFIAFISSLLGILIAFQLQDWQEKRNENEKIEITLRSIKREIESDLKIYKTNADTIGQWLDYCNFIFDHQNRGVRGMLATEKRFISFQAKNQNRKEYIKFIKKYNDSLNLYDFTLQLDVAPKSGLSTNNWEAAKSSGVLNNIDHSRMAVLTEIYYWINIDLGNSDSDFIKLQIKKRDNFDDLGEIMEIYRKIAAVSQLKKKKIEENYNKINWKIEE